MNRFPVIVLLLLVLYHAAQGQSDVEGSPSRSMPVTESEEGIFSFTIPGVIRQEIIGRAKGDSVFLPFVELCGLLSLRHEVSATFDELRGELPAGQPFIIRREDGIATFRMKELRFPSSAVEVIDGIVYVERELLGACFGIPLDYDRSRLAITMQASIKVPIVARVQNRKKYAALKMRRAGEAGGADDIDVDRQILGTLAVDWSASASYQKETGYNMSGFYGVGGPLLFGVVNLGGTGRFTPRDTAPVALDISDWQWSFTLPGSSFLRQVMIGGNYASLSPNYWAELSNAPLSPRQWLSDHVINGRTEPGWTVELYERGELAQVAQADGAGRYSFTLPIGFNPHNIELRHLGPFGELDVVNRRIEAGYEQLPAGEVEYRALFRSDGLADDVPVASLATMRAGIAPWLTLGVNATARAGRINSLHYDSIRPTAFLRLWPGESTHLGLSYDAYARTFGGNVDITFPGETRAYISVDRFVPDQRLITGSAVASIPIGVSVISLNSRYRNEEGRWDVDLLPQIAAYIAGYSVNLSSMIGLHSQLPPPSVGEDDVEKRVNGPLISTLSISKSLFPQFYVRSSVRYDHVDKVFSDIDIGSTYSLSRNLRASAGYSIDSLKWRTGNLRFETSAMLFDHGLQISLLYMVPGLLWKNGKLQASINVDLGFGRMRAETDYSDDRLMSRSFITGGLLLSGSGLRTTTEGASGKTSIVVRPFRDENANGEWDGDEEGLPDIDVRLSFVEIESSSPDGRFYGLAPDLVYTASIDRWSFADLNLFPRKSRLSVYGVASTVHAIDVAFAPGFDANGMCRIQRADGTSAGSLAAAINGLHARLVAHDGSAEFEGEVFADGTLNFTGASRGTYRVLFEEEEVADRGLKLRYAPDMIVLDHDSTRIDDIVFIPLKEAGDAGRDR